MLVLLHHRRLRSLLQLCNRTMLQWAQAAGGLCSSGPLFGPTKQAQGTTDGRRIWGTRGDAASDGAVEGRYGRYAEGGGCAGHAAIAISRCGAAAARRPVRRCFFTLLIALRSDERASANRTEALMQGSGARVPVHSTLRGHEAIFRCTVNSISTFFLNSCTCAHLVRSRKPLCGPQ